MVSPQKQNGFVGIANEIWDEILRRSFTKRQKDILDFILRLSYGCGRKVALIPKNKDFMLCGVGENHIKDEIDILVERLVIARGKNKGEYLFNKKYVQWSIPFVNSWDDERFKKLIHLNLVEAKKERTELPELGTFEEEDVEEKLPEIGTFEGQGTSRNGNLQQANFPNQEEIQEDENMDKLPETGTFEKKNFPKKEPQLPETGSLTPDFPSNDAASQPSKKGLKKLNNKESKDKTIVEIVDYLNAVTGKKFSSGTKETVKLISGRIKEGRTFDDFKHVIDVKTAEWLGDEKMDHYLKPTTLFAQSNFESYLNQKMPRRDGDGKHRGNSQESGIQKMAGPGNRTSQTTGGKRRITEEEFESFGIGQ